METADTAAAAAAVAAAAVAAEGSEGAAATEAWTAFSQALSCTPGPSRSSSRFFFCDTQRVLDAAPRLRSAGLAPVARACVLDAALTVVAAVRGNRGNSGGDGDRGGDHHDGDDHAADADVLPLLRRLVRAASEVDLVLAALGGDPLEARRFRSAVASLFFGTGGCRMQAALLAFFKRHFDTFCARGGVPEPEFEEFCVMLQRLQLVFVSEAIFSELLFAEIAARTRAESEGEFGKRLLAGLVEWMDRVVFPWLGLVVPDTRTFRQWKGRLDFFLLHSFAALRTGELWDLIVAYPESIPALEDLGEALHRVDHSREVADALEASLRDRLLHLGATTGDIISVYVNLVRALNLIDPNGVLLCRVSQQMRPCLAAREDTVRCILEACTDPDSELYEELKMGSPSAAPAGSAGRGRGAAAQRAPADELEDEDTSTHWLPEPFEPLDSASSGLRRGDTIDMLVSVYGSPERFVDEYRGMLAGRLFAAHTFECDEEIKVVELLKLRFGESALAKCEVMLNDVAQSRRVNPNCRALTLQGADDEDAGEDFAIDATIISYRFWPDPAGDLALGFAPHPVVEEKMRQYTAAFSTLKRRRLTFLQNVGSVELELDFGESAVFTLEVAPIHASIALHFQDRQVHALADLAALMRMPPDVLREQLVFWRHKGLLDLRASGEYALVENPAEALSSAVHLPTVPAEETDAAAPHQRMSEEDERVISNYVTGMLRALGPLDPTGLHWRLNSHCEKYTWDEGELHAWLLEQVKAGKLETRGGNFLIRKQ